MILSAPVINTGQAPGELITIRYRGSDSHRSGVDADHGHDSSSMCWVQLSGSYAREVYRNL